MRIIRRIALISPSPNTRGVTPFIQNTYIYIHVWVQFGPQLAHLAVVQFGSKPLNGLTSRFVGILNPIRCVGSIRKAFASTRNYLWRCGMHGHPHRSLWSAIDQQWLLSSSCGSWDLRICKGRGDSHTLSLQNPLIWLYIIHPHNFVCRCTWIGSHLQTKCANVIREKRPLVSSLYEPVDRVWEITSWS